MSSLRSFLFFILRENSSGSLLLSAEGSWCGRYCT